MKCITLFFSIKVILMCTVKPGLLRKVGGSVFLPFKTFCENQIQKSALFPYNKLLLYVEICQMSQNCQEMFRNNSIVIILSLGYQVDETHY